MGRISFQKRQKEMKRQEKQQMKAERRAQRKLAKTEPEAVTDQLGPFPDEEGVEQDLGAPTVDPEPRPQG